MMIVQMTLKALCHVVDVAHPGGDERLARIERAHAATTDQHDGCGAPGAAQHGLANLFDELRVDLPIRFIDPGNMDGSRRVANEQILHIGSHVDEYGIGVFLKELVRLLGRKRLDLMACHVRAFLARIPRRMRHTVSIMVLSAVQPKHMGAFVRPPKPLMRLAGQAIQDYQMIRPGDRLLLALSGGKDSLSLLHVLLSLRARAPIPFELAAATVDPCIAGFDPSFLKEYVPALGIPYFYERQQIVERAADTMHGDSFCSYCARMRRGILYATARRERYNVLVMGQHLDDLAESFLMAAFHNGRLRTMKAHYRIDAGDLRVIRPFVYVRERQTRDFAHRSNLPAILDNCPACFRMPTRRVEMKALLAEQERAFPGLFDSLLSTMRPMMQANGIPLVS